MGILEDIQRKRKYGELRVLTKERILMRFTMEQLQKFYSIYVDPKAMDSNGKRPVEEISVLSLAQDFMAAQGTSQRKKLISGLENNVSFDEIAAYAGKIKVGIADIMKDYEEQKARI